MQLRVKHLVIPVSLIAGVGAALITTAVAQSGGQRSTQAVPPFTAPGTVVALVTDVPLNGPDEFMVAPNPADPPLNPTGDPVATGEVLITVNATTGVVCGSLKTTNLAPFFGFHIHKGAVDVRNAGPLVSFEVPAAGATGSYAKCVTTTPVIAAGIATDPTGYYVNVHTAAIPTGAISAQLDYRTQFTQEAEETQLLAAPTRAYDTRFNGAGKFGPSTTRVIDLSGSGVPLGTRAAIVTVTVTGADAAGFLTVYSGGLAVAPNTSNVNFSAGVDVASNITVATDGTGTIKITSGATGTENVIVDVVGYLI